MYAGGSLGVVLLRGGGKQDETLAAVDVRCFGFARLCPELPCATSALLLGEPLLDL